MNTKFKEIFYNKLLNESAKQKIQQYKINDPHLINFLYRYESLVEWGKVKSVDDLNAYISDVLIQKLDDQTDYSKIKEVKKTLFTTYAAPLNKKYSLSDTASANIESTSEMKLAVFI